MPSRLPKERPLRFPFFTHMEFVTQVANLIGSRGARQLQLQEFFVVGGGVIPPLDAEGGEDAIMRPPAEQPQPASQPASAREIWRFFREIIGGAV